MSDESILARISTLIDEEHQLRSQPAEPEATAQRLKHLEEQLDQCWDLLRQRRARREFGKNPDDAEARDIGTVERYQG
jgi:hypothetical protein